MENTLTTQQPETVSEEMISTAPQNYLLAKLSSPFVFLCLLIAIAQCGLALYLPSLPAIASTFSAQSSLVQNTVVYYLIGIATSQLFYGPLSDHYGRKNVALFGIGIFIVGSVLAIFSWTIYVFLLARLVQGIGIGSATIVSRAVLRDSFHGANYIEAGSKLASIVAIVPIVAPMLGGYIQAIAGWRTNFIILLGFSVSVFILWYFSFQETNKCDHKINSISILSVLRNYLMIAKSPAFLKNAFCGGITYSGEVVILSIAPFLIQTKLSVSEIKYGWLMFILAVGFMTGARISSRLAIKIACYRLILIGLSFTTLASLMLLMISVTNYLYLLVIMIPMALFMLGTGFVYPNTSVTAVGQFPNNAGTASALFSGIQGLLAATIGILVSLFDSSVLTPMAVTLTCLCLFSWIIFCKNNGFRIQTI